VDLFDDKTFTDAVIETLREAKFGPERNGWIDEWEKDRKNFDKERFLTLVDAIGKGRFAQRLATRIGDLDPPSYIEGAIKFVTERA
jgi:putative ATP-dependent endonuclease of OLD family